MTAIPSRPPIFEGGFLGGCFRSRSSDADWDFFPLGRWGRGYRLNDEEMARLQRLERRMLAIAFIAWLGASFVLAIRLTPPVSAHFAYYGVSLAILLASKLAYDAVVRWLVRHNHAAERPLTRAELESWAETRKPRATRLSVSRSLVALVIAAALTAGGAIMFCQTMDLIDVERRWIGMIGGVFIAMVGLRWAYWSVVSLRRFSSRRRSQ